jgi:hypothetical protein
MMMSSGIARPILITTVLSVNICHGYCQTVAADSIIATVEQLAKDIIYQDQDTNYIKSYADKLSVKLLVLNKFNYFQLSDKNLGNRVRFRPDLGVKIGIGLAYKWLALDLAANIGLGEKQISNTRYRDLQVKAFTIKQYLRARYQYYSGYKVVYTAGFDLEPSEEAKLRPDIRTIQLGLQYLYAYNYGKFSLRAPFVQNEHQLKSAGSLLIGGGFQYYDLDADSSVIDAEMEPYFDPLLYVSQLNTMTLSISMGYIYTFVPVKGFFITLGLIPGLGLSGGDYRTENRKQIKASFTYRIKTMGAIGYNGRKFFTGIQSIGAYQPVRLDKKLRIYINEGRASFFLGYRF